MCMYINLQISMSLRSSGHTLGYQDRLGYQTGPPACQPTKTIGIYIVSPQLLGTTSDQLHLTQICPRSTPGPGPPSPKLAQTLLAISTT